MSRRRRVPLPSHNWPVREVNRRHAAGLAALASGELLDIGCGAKPYEHLFGPYVERYVGLEHPDTLHGAGRVDVWGRADELPFDDGSFDTVVAFQVLEHCEEPARVLAEAHRVLRPGGLVAMTTPFLWGVHEAPRDFYRYTEHGLRHLFGQAGFTAVAVRPVCGYWITTGLHLSYELARFRRWPLLPIVLLVQQAALVATALLDRVDRRVDSTAGYVTVARRP